jgi:hypothetical protein
LEDLVERRVRDRDGLIPWSEGPKLLAVKEWRETHATAGLSDTLEDFFATHGLCHDCGSHGAHMIGWSKPANEIDTKAAEEFGIGELPLYETCPTCNGTGKADQSEWNGLSW